MQVFKKPWGWDIDPWKFYFPAELMILNPDPNSPEKSKNVYTFNNEDAHDFGVPLFYSVRYNGKFYEAHASYNKGS